MCPFTLAKNFIRGGKGGQTCDWGACPLSTLRTAPINSISCDDFEVQSQLDLLKFLTKSINISL